MHCGNEQWRKAAICAAVMLASANAGLGQEQAGRVARPRAGRQEGPGPTRSDSAPDEPGGDLLNGLHLPADRRGSAHLELTDRRGFRWDIRDTGTIARGTNYALRNASFIHIDGGQFAASPDGKARISADGRELELGPSQHSGMKVFRRIRVYRDLPLCRWLEIFENASDSPRTVRIGLSTTLPHGTRQVIGSSGGESLSSEDWAFIAVHREVGGRQVPHLLLVTRDPKSKLSPSVRLEGNRVSMRWQFAVPARGTSVLCHFKSQGDQADLEKIIKRWKLRPLLVDLPRPVLKRIVNMRLSDDDIEPLAIERAGLADRVVLGNGDVLMGQIKNDPYVMKAFTGELTIPADRVIGLMSRGEGHEGLLLALADGQVISGEPANATVRLALATGGELHVPVSRIRQCGYRITQAKPQDLVPTAPMLILQTGDRLALEGDGPPLTLQAPYGEVALPPGSLRSIRLDPSGDGAARVLLINGSVMSGILGPEVLHVRLRLGPDIAVRRRRIRWVVWPAEIDEPGNLAVIVLRNTDRLIGRMTEEDLALHTDFGTIPVDPKNVSAMMFDQARPGKVAIRLWGGSTVRGELTKSELRFAVEPGPILDVDVAQMVSYRQAVALPPKQTLARIQQLLGQLGSDVYEDRQSAGKELIRIGPLAVPLLKEHLDDGDPEVRQRVKGILEEIGDAADDAADDSVPPLGEMGMQQMPGLINH